MLSRSDYIAFQRPVRGILKECFCGVDLDSLPDEAYYGGYGYTNLTKDKEYYYTDNATNFKDELIRVCQGLPIYPSISKKFCGTIAFSDLLPDDMSTQRELLKACELVDEFFALLEINKLGGLDKSFISKYGFNMFSIDPDYKDVIKPNRSAYVQEKAEPDAE